MLAAEAAADAAYVQRAWPPEAAQRPFIEYLRSQYDATQLRAIEVCFLPPDWHQQQRLKLYMMNNSDTQYDATLLRGIDVHWLHTSKAVLGMLPPTAKCACAELAELVSCCG